MNKDNRLYLIWWNASMYGEDEVKQTLFSFFSDENGFDKESIEKVSQLEAGNACMLDDGWVIVTRVR